MQLIVSACRTLANRLRLRLLRVIHDKPGQPVHVLAAAVKQPPDAVSHQLKLLCDYQFARAAPSGRRVFYHPVASGATSHPFLRGLRELLDEALLAAWKIRTPDKVCEFETGRWDDSLLKLFTTYTHLRRLLILRLLDSHGAVTIASVSEQIGMSPDAAYRHLDKLRRRGVVASSGTHPVYWSVVPVTGAALRQRLLACVLRELQRSQTAVGKFAHL